MPPSLPQDALPDAPQDAPQDALDWMIALQDAPQDQDLHRRFRDWLAASPDHGRDWQELGAVDTLIVQAATITPLPKNRQRRTIAITVTALAACLALAVLPGLSLWWRADAVTGAGETRVLDLADGSTVTLGADSALRFRQDDGGRYADLLRGEAFFQVRRDPARPFSVQADDTRARVLGTSFNVRRDHDGAEIAVAEGLVEVSRGGHSARLPAGHWAESNPHGLTQGNVAVDLVASWRQGHLVVKDRPLSEIVEILGRYHSGTIIVHGDLSRRRVTGIFDLADPAQALAAVLAPQGGSVTRVTPWILLIRG